jgi:hypothetical protein
LPELGVQDTALECRLEVNSAHLEAHRLDALDGKAHLRFALAQWAEVEGLVGDRGQRIAGRFFGGWRRHLLGLLRWRREIAVEVDGVAVHVEDDPGYIAAAVDTALGPELEALALDGSLVKLDPGAVGGKAGVELEPAGVGLGRIERLAQPGGKPAHGRHVEIDGAIEPGFGLLPDSALEAGRHLL